MSLMFLSDLSGVLLGWLMGFLSLFLILLVLVQRGKGGGLTGALGGPGGQSAFGSKAGDTFTIITVAVAAIWGFVCAFTMWLLGSHAPVANITPPTTVINVGEDAGETGDLTIPGGDSMGLSGLSAGGESAEEANDIELQPADGEGSADTAGEDQETEGESTEDASLELGDDPDAATEE